MQRFKRILFLAKGSGKIKTLLKHAADLAASNGAELTIMDVLQRPPAETETFLEGISSSKLEEMLVAERQSQLANLASLVDREGLTVRARVAVGRVFSEVVREVLRNHHDLVMKASEGRGGHESNLFGSIDLQLIRGCPCPVWINKPRKSAGYTRILAAVDPDPADEKKIKLNTLIMDLGTSLAEREDCDLYIVHSWILYSEPVLKLVFGKGKVKELAKQTRKRHRQWLQELLDRYDSVDTRGRVYLLQGPAEKVIPRIARDRRFDLIIMGTAARSGLPEFMIGNTAEDVLNQVDCSILTVKPADFVSPVRLQD